MLKLMSQVFFVSMGSANVLVMNKII